MAGEKEDWQENQKEEEIPSQTPQVKWMKGDFVLAV